MIPSASVKSHRWLFLSVAVCALALTACEPHAVTPGAEWTRVAPENVGLGYEKMRRLLNEADGKEATLVIERLGYLIWDDGEPDAPVTLPAPLARSLEPLVANEQPAARNLPTDASAMSTLDITRLGLLINRMGKWQGKQVVDKKTVAGILDSSDAWQADDMNYESGIYYYAGSPDSLWIILCPQQKTVLVAVAANGEGLPPAKFYANAVIDSIRAME